MEENPQAFQSQTGFDLYFAFAPLLEDLAQVILGTSGNPGKLPDFEDLLHACIFFLFDIP